MKTNNYMTLDNVCYGTLLIFAFWYLEFSLATKMKKLRDISHDIVNINSLMIYYYYAIILYLCDARIHIIVSHVLVGTSLLCCDVLDGTLFRIDARRLLLFSITQSLYTYYISSTLLYWKITFFIYISFRFLIKFYTLSSLPLFFYIISSNIVILPDYYFLLCFVNMFCILFCLYYKSLFNTELLMNYRTIYINISIPFVMTIIESNMYTQDIFLYDLQYKWEPLVI